MTPARKRFATLAAIMKAFLNAAATTVFIAAGVRLLHSFNSELAPVSMKWRMTLPTLTDSPIGSVFWFLVLYLIGRRLPRTFTNVAFPLLAVGGVVIIARAFYFFPPSLGYAYYVNQYPHLVENYWPADKYNFVLTAFFCLWFVIRSLPCSWQWPSTPIANLIVWITGFIITTRILSILPLSFLASDHRIPALCIMAAGAAASVAAAWKFRDMPFFILSLQACLIFAFFGGFFLVYTIPPFAP